MELVYKASCDLYLDIFDDISQEYKRISLIPKTQNQLQKYSVEFKVDGFAKLQKSKKRILLKIGILERRKSLKKSIV